MHTMKQVVVCFRYKCIW